MYIVRTLYLENAEQLKKKDKQYEPTLSLGCTFQVFLAYARYIKSIMSIKVNIRSDGIL